MLYYPINAFNPHSTKKVKVYFVDWVEFYLLGGILPRDHLPMWLSGALPSPSRPLLSGRPPEGRAEDCQNCGAVMSPVHQCDETETASESDIDTRSEPACVKLCHDTNKETEMWCSEENANCWCDTDCDDACDCECIDDENKNCYFWKRVEKKQFSL